LNMIDTTIDTEGIIYFEDSTRNNKLLSITRENFTFNHDAGIDNNYIKCGDTKSGIGEVGWVMPRDATIVSLTARYGTGYATTKGFEIRTNGVATPLHSFTLTRDIEFSDTTLNIDLNAEDRLQIFVVAAESGAGDITVVLEIAWQAPEGTPDPKPTRYTDAEAVTATQAARDVLEAYLLDKLLDVSGSLQTQIDGKADTSHTHDASDVTTGTFADVLISQSSVVQHQAALDHGAISGLSDDDHPQYSLVDGSRAFTSTVGGVDPVASSDLVTKNYVDNQILTLRNELLTVSGSLQSDIDQLREELIALSGTLFPPFTGQEVSIDLEGSNEALSNQTPQDIGIANSWTISAWLNPDLVDWNNRTFLHLQAGSGGANYFHMRARDSSPDPTVQALHVEFGDSNGNTIKMYIFDNVFVESSWQLITVTWNGTDLIVYRNDMILTPFLKFVDNSGSMTNTNRKVTIGGFDPTGAYQWDGKCYSVAIWDTVLGANEVSTIYNFGDGRFDLNTDSGNYASSANLPHWWRLGFDSNDIGKDYGNHTVLINVMEDAFGIDVTDIVNDFPGM
jgi:hypothetical protein